MNLLTKDLTEEGRRIRTFVFRVVLIAAVFAVIWVGNFDSEGTPRRGGEFVGIEVFLRLALGLVAVVTVLAPTVTVPSVKEEMEKGSMDILISSGVSPRTIVRAKILSGSIVPIAVVFACSPMVAMASYYGGVSPWQVVVVSLLLCVLAFLYATVGVLTALRKSSRKSPMTRMFGWLMGYNVLTAVVTLNPFTSVVTCVLNGDIVRPLLTTSFNLVLAAFASRQAIQECDPGRKSEGLEAWFPDLRVSFARAVFSEERYRNRPICWKELQEGEYVSMHSLLLGFVCLAGVLSAGFLLLSGQLWSGAEMAELGYFRFFIGCHVVLLLVLSVLLLSQTISMEREHNTLDLLLLTGIPPMRLIAIKAQTLLVSLRILLISLFVHVVVMVIVIFVGVTAGSSAWTFARWFAGLALVCSQFCFLCATAVSWSAIAKTRVRSVVPAMMTVAVVLVVPLMAEPVFGERLFLAHASLLHVLAFWPEKIEILAAAFWTVMFVSLSAVLLRLAVTRIGQPED